MSSSHERRIQNQFGSFCIKVLKNEANAIQREKTRQRNWEVPFEELSDKRIAPIAQEDNYFANDHIFLVMEIPIVVTGDHFANAIAKLSKEKRDIILLYYFLNMSDREISERMRVVRQAISKRRSNILKELKKYMAEEGFD